MANIAVLIGTGNAGEDALHKTPWLRHLDKKHNIYIASRLKPEIQLTNQLRELIGDVEFDDLNNAMHTTIDMAQVFSVIYDSPYLNNQYTNAEMDELQKWLGISFNYISSFDRRFYDREKQTDKRKLDDVYNYSSGLIEFFRHFFTENHIDVFINSIEDDIFSVTAYYVAKKLGVQVIGFMGGRFPKKGVMFCKNFTDVCIWNEQNIAWSEIESLYSVSTIAGDKTPAKNARHWRLSSLPERLKLKTFINYKRLRSSLIGINGYERFILKDIRISHELKERFTKLLRRRLIKTILGDPAYDDNYFFFPLHYMDDAQITFREPPLNQFTLISTISRALPVGYSLYVKPHPHYFGTDVSFRKLAKVSKLDNVKIVNPRIPPIKLIQNSKGVITANSTTGLEALIMGIPVLTFGHDFYCKEHLCYVVRDINKLSQTLMDLINGNGQPERETVIAFVKAVYANTVWINRMDYHYVPFGLTEDDGKNIAAALNRIFETV